MATQTHMQISLDDVGILAATLGTEHPLTLRADAAIAGLADADQNAYRKAAKEQVREGELEVDPGAVVSVGSDDGAYVQAWIWVSAYDAGIDDGEEQYVEDEFPRADTKGFPG